MTLELQRIERLWLVSEHTEPVAEIYLDYWDQLNEVVLYADTPDEIQLQVLHLAASHAQQFVKNRTVPRMGGLMFAEYHNPNLTAADSHRLMDFGLIPEQIQQLDFETIVEELRLLQVDVIVARHKTAEQAIEHAVRQIGVPSLRYAPTSDNTIFEDVITVQFSVARPEHFTFWKSQNVPTGRGWDLDVVPHYHPVMNGWKEVGMVNGHSDAYIGGKTVRRIYCPKAAQSNRHGRNYGTSWDHVKHPFYAIGRSMSVSLIRTKLRSREGAEELTKLLRAALGQSKEYVAISGGFRAPMKCAHNRLLELKRPSPWPDARRPGAPQHLARGSEEHCVWAYRTLEAEGELDKSHVPTWFIKEGWLEIYEGAEIRPGLF